MACETLSMSYTATNASVAATGSFFDDFASSVFWSAMSESALRHRNVAIGGINARNVKRVSFSLSVAPSVSKNFAM